MTQNDAKEFNKFIQFRIDEEIYISPDIDDGFEAINERIREKLKLLQKYKINNEDRLFIFTPSLFVVSSMDVDKKMRQ